MANNVETSSKLAHSWVPCRVIECRYYKLGFCKKAERCTFYHGLHDQRRPPDLCKTQLCPDMKDGSTCAKQNECMYAHSTEELRRPPRKSVLCKAWLNDKICSYLDCHYAHSFDEVTTELLHPELEGIPIPPADSPKSLYSPPILYYGSKCPDEIPPPPPPEEKNVSSLKNNKSFCCKYDTIDSYSKMVFVPPPPSCDKTISTCACDDVSSNTSKKDKENSKSENSRTISLLSTYSTDSDAAVLSSRTPSTSPPAVFSPFIDLAMASSFHGRYSSTTCETHCTPLASKTIDKTSKSCDSLLNNLSPISCATCSTNKTYSHNFIESKGIKPLCLTRKSKKKLHYRTSDTENESINGNSKTATAYFFAKKNYEDRNQNNNIKAKGREDTDSDTEADTLLIQSQFHENIKKRKKNLSVGTETDGSLSNSSYVVHNNTPHYFNASSHFWNYGLTCFLNPITAPSNTCSLHNSPQYGRNLYTERSLSSSTVFPTIIDGYKNNLYNMGYYPNCSVENGFVQCTYNPNSYGATEFSHKTSNKIDEIILFLLTWGNDLTRYILESAAVPIHMYED